MISIEVMNLILVLGKLLIKEICQVIFYALAIYANILNTIKGLQNKNKNG